MEQINYVLNTSYSEQKFSNPNLHLLNSFNFETTEKVIGVKRDTDYVILHNARPDIQLKVKDKIAWNNDAFHTYKFTQIGKIVDVSKPEILPFSPKEMERNEYRKARGLPLLKQRRRFIFELEGKPLNENNQFDDLTYSLYSIHNYVKPISHFQHQLTIVGEKDFETIEKGWIYLYRTLFGKIANVLPFENRFEFSLMVSREYKTVHFKGLPYEELLKKLIDYIEVRIHGRGHLITNTSIMLKTIGEKINEDLSPVGFIPYERSDGRAKHGDEIMTQARLFESLFTAYKELDITSIFMKKDPHSERFNKLFERREWPLNLN